MNLCEKDVGGPEHNILVEEVRVRLFILLPF